MYKYIRGKGWVEDPGFETIEAVTVNGVKVRLEKRKPEIGEPFTWHNLRAGKPEWDLERWVSWMSMFNVPERLHIGDFMPDGVDYCTVVVL